MATCITDFVVVLFRELVKFLVEGAEGDWLLSRNLYIALPEFIASITTFGLLERVSEAVQRGVLHRLVVLLGLNSETRRKIAKVVPEVVHNSTRHHLSRAGLLVVEDRRGFT